MSLPRFEHVILTRFNTLFLDGSMVFEDPRREGGMIYENPKKADAWMDSRMPMFEETKRSVLSQRGEFKWIISLDERTPQRYLDQIKTDDRIIITHREVMYAMKDYTPQADWVITSRIDCDDQYLAGFVRSVQSMFKPKIMAIDVGFLKLDWPTQNVYTASPIDKGSMFISLVEPAERVLTVFCRPHYKIQEYPMRGEFGNFSEHVHIPLEMAHKPRALMVCHGENLANRVSKGDSYYCKRGEVNKLIKNS